MHLGILPFQIYISSKTYVLNDQTLYIYSFFLFFFYKKKTKADKMDFMCDRKTSTKRLSYKLQWLCNGATPQCKDKGPFGFLVFLVFDVKKPPVCSQRSKNGNSDAYFFILKLCFLSLKTATNSQV